MANFSVDRPGRYLLTTRSSAGATGEVAVGRSATGRPFVARAVTGAAIALLGLLVGMALALATFFRRRSIRRVAPSPGPVVT